MGSRALRLVGTRPQMTGFSYSRKGGQIGFSCFSLRRVDPSGPDDLFLDQGGRLQKRRLSS